MLGVFRNQALEEIPEVERYVWIGVLLNDKRAGCVLNEDGEGSV